MGYEHDRILWMIQGVLIGVAVKIARSEQRASNFGHRKRHVVRMSPILTEGEHNGMICVANLARLCLASLFTPTKND